MATSNERGGRADNTDNTMSMEPIGIIISRGRRDEPVPAFSAYVWGPPAPEAAEPGAGSQAA
ncbi:MAG TPA: hypothetical protein VIQ74_00465 [Gemmatimonadaceae bacterium]